MPDGWSAEAPECLAAFEKHRLTDSFLKQWGVPISNALNAMMDVLEIPDIVIAGHNLQGDLKVLRGELRRAGHEDYYKTTRWIDTAHSNTAICKLPRTDGKNGYKLPKLTEAYKHWMGREMSGNHGAFNDALACKQIYAKMVAAGVEVKIGEPKGADAKRHAPAPKSATPAAAQAAAETSGSPAQADDNTDDIY